MNIRTAGFCGACFLLVISYGVHADEKELVLNSRHTEVPFCYVRGGVRSWPILTRRLKPNESLTVAVQLADSTKRAGNVIQVGEVSLSVANGAFTIDARQESRESEPLKIQFELTLQRNGQTEETRHHQIRPAPPPRPISYIADLSSDLVRIFAMQEAGRFRPITKDGFDQYFRRLQAHGVSRLIVWHSPFPFFTSPSDHDPEHWRRYVLQARAILDCPELDQSLRTSRSLPPWLSVRFAMAMRLNPEAGRLFAQSAAEHGISLSASFRPFETALSKYFEVPAFDHDGRYLWGFLPMAMPLVNDQPDQVCFGNYRVLLEQLNRSDFGRLSAIELPGLTAQEVTRLIEQFGPAGGFEVRASRVPPIDVTSFVLVRQPTGQFQLKPFSDVRGRTEADGRLISNLRLEWGPNNVARIAGLEKFRSDNPESEPSYWFIRHVQQPSGDPSRSSVMLDKDFPVRLVSSAGNVLNRETTYWVFAEGTDAGKETRFAGITSDGNFRTGYYNCLSSIKALLNQPQRVSLSGNTIVVDRGARWSPEMVDFQQPAARKMAIAQLSTLLALPGAEIAGRDTSTPPRPAYDEIFISTRSHLELPAMVGDGEDGHQPLAHYLRTQRPLYCAIGLDKAYAPRSVIQDDRLQRAAASPRTVNQITAWQDGEWRDSCQSADSPFHWRHARNVAVAQGLTQLLRDLEQAFPNVRIRAIVPPREESMQRIAQSLAKMPLPADAPRRNYFRYLCPTNNYVPAIGEGMAMVDLTGTRIEPVFLGSGDSRFDQAPFEMYVREQISDLADNRGSQFRGPRSYFFECQLSLRVSDTAVARQHREGVIKHLLCYTNDIREVLLYESADWLYYMPLSDADLCGYNFLDAPRK